MKLRSSEIFDNFAKIALDKGLISEAAEGVIKTASAESTNPRYDSKTLSDIEILYGVRPNGKDEKDIIDQAHPESVIIAPAYDRLNGLVENVKERHDIMVGIAMKPHQGKLTGHKYAKQDLLNELIRLGTFLDSKGQEDLMSLADGCTEKLTKEASTFKDWGQLGAVIAPFSAAVLIGGTGAVTWPVWAVAGLVLGVVGVLNNFGDKIDQGTYGNAKRAITRLESINNEYRMVDEDRSDIAPKINDMISEIKKLTNLSEEMHAKNANVSSVNSIKQANELTEQYKKIASNIEANIPSWINFLKSQLTTAVTHDSDLWSAIKGVGHFIWPDEIEKAISALKTLQENVGKSKAAIKSAVSASIDYAKQNKNPIEQAASSEGGKETPEAPTPSKEPDTFQKALDLLRGKPSQQQGKSSPSSSEVDKFIESINLGSK